jgi:hypothetical protein
VWNLWHTILRRTFPSDRYNRDQEIKAQLELRGIRSLSRYAKERIRTGRALSTFDRYHIALLGSRADRLPRQLEKAYLAKIWNLSKGITYLGVPVSNPPARPPDKHFPFDGWLSSIELLTPFPSLQDLARKSIDWLWEQRNEGGLWDFGHRSPVSTHFPLSESWRKKGARESDWTTRVLVLLRKYYDR